MLSETPDTQSKYIRRHVRRIRDSLSGEYPDTFDRLLRAKEYPSGNEAVLEMYAESALLVRFLVDTEGESELVRLVGRLFDVDLE